MTANVHQGEMIVPAAQTPWAQSLMANAAAGSTSHSTTSNINMSGGFYDARGLAKTVSKAQSRNNSFSKRYR